MSAHSVSGEESPTCPSLFHPTTAQDGKLVRIRIPGGILGSEQCQVLAEAIAYLNSNTIDITNRANLQIRGLSASMPPEVLLKLQDAGLAAKNPELDRFRNIMASPTAGIDPEQLIDTRPLVRQLDEYLASNLNLAGLSPKFSIGIDGGEKVSIEQQPNDIFFKAVAVEDKVYFNLYIAGINLETAVIPENCLSLVGAIAQVYLDLVPANITRKPRLKQVIEDFGRSNYIDRLQLYLSSSCLSARLSTERSRSATSLHLGIYPQIQPDLFYIGISLPLGRLELNQLRGIAEIIENYGNGTLKLTPWRSILLPDIRDRNLDTVQQKLAELGLSIKNNNIWGGLVACSGTTGCAASFTDTQGDAIALARYLADNITLNQPVTIHLSGCPKSCAHHGSSDLTLVGKSCRENGGEIAGYHLYGGDAELPFGKQLLANLEPSQLPPKITQILSNYQEKGTEQHLSWAEFSDRWFDTEDNEC
ncbi:precorrin-3B synthase [Merismopedia glauca]|uniref:precorrin-3B synthase n=1 Tax=Merismopedia glauca TaxID=292586 RepID=UPI0015E663C9|nr:precorrin-3B synthase [Merismopedia glauca]